MKKAMMVLLILVVAGSAVYAQGFLSYPPSLQPGNILIDAGVGWTFAPTIGATITVPPVSLSLDYCLPVGVPVSIGVLFSVYQWQYSYTGFLPWTDVWTYATGGARASWHFNLPVSQLDLYAGVFMGYTYFASNTNRLTSLGYNPLNYGGLAYGGQVGAHFYFTRNLGLLVEAGYPFVARAGLALKF